MTVTETALRRLLAGLVAVAQIENAAIPVPTRNREVAKLWEDIDPPADTGVVPVSAVMNLRDGENEILSEALGAGENYELEHVALLEYMVREADDSKRDAAFDAGVEDICDYIDTLRPSPSAAAVLQLNDPEDEESPEAYATVRLARVRTSGLVTDGAAQIKSAVLQISLTFHSRYPI